MKIKKKAEENNANIITTEKDFMKISQFDKKDIKYLEVDLQIENENDLITFLKSKKDE